MIDGKSLEFIMQREMAIVTSRQITDKVSEIRFEKETNQYKIGDKTLDLSFWRNPEARIFDKAILWLLERNEESPFGDKQLISEFGDNVTTAHNVSRAMNKANPDKDDLTTKDNITHALTQELTRSIEEASEPSDSIHERATPDWEMVKMLIETTKSETDIAVRFETIFKLNLVLGNYNFKELPEDIRNGLTGFFGKPSVVNGRIVTKENQRINYCEYTENYHHPGLIIKGVGWNEKSEWISGATDGLLIGEEGGIVFPGVLLAPQKRLLKLIEIVYFLQGIGMKIDEVDIPVMCIGLVRPVKKDFEHMTQKVKEFVKK